MNATSPLVSRTFIASVLSLSIFTGVEGFIVFYHRDHKNLINFYTFFWVNRLFKKPHQGQLATIQSVRGLRGEGVRGGWEITNRESLVRDVTMGVVRLPPARRDDYDQ